MKLKSLRNITKSLKAVLVELHSSGLQDHNIRHRCAEFFVALELCKRGHDVRILGDRKNGDADIYLADINKNVEVKSGKCDKYNWAYASFAKGKQIRSKQFDFCVFVTFAYDDEGVKDILVFERRDLQEIKNYRKGVARYESSNPCLFMYAPNLDEFDAWIKEKKLKAFKIERIVHKPSNEFKDSWNKIK